MGQTEPMNQEMEFDIGEEENEATVEMNEDGSEAIVLNGTVTDMERYRFLMGRLEGIKLVDQIIRDKVDKHSEDF